MIHETGHALGLPDYYDYDGSIGPKGGVGGLDMMDANKGDHNCFSKFLLEWINPTAYSTRNHTLTLYASGNTRDQSAIVVMPGAVQGDAFGEFFMIQNRHRVGNDAGAGYPNDGLLIWHVDSTLNYFGTDFAYDNSYTSHKLLRLMEADGLEEIEKDLDADGEDYYVSGKTFGTTTIPDSNRYDGTSTGGRGFRHRTLRKSDVLQTQHRLPCSSNTWDPFSGGWRCFGVLGSHVELERF